MEQTKERKITKSNLAKELEKMDTTEFLNWLFAEEKETYGQSK